MAQGQPADQSAHPAISLDPLEVEPESKMNGTTALPHTSKHIWVITGPAGCGKTTVAEHLRDELSFPYLEGDDFHTPANKEKMASNHPLNDADRWDWLISLREEAIKTLQTSDSVLVTCSALKNKYRDVIRIAAYNHPSREVHFLYLRVGEDTLRSRVHGRTDHYMKDSMVRSQMDALEEPLDESDCYVIDVNKGKEAVQQKALEVVKEVLERYEVRSHGA